MEVEMMSNMCQVGRLRVRTTRPRADEFFRFDAVPFAPVPSV